MKRRNLKIAICSFLAMTALLLSMSASGVVFAKGTSSTTSAGTIPASATRVSTPAVSSHNTNLNSLKVLSAAATKQAASSHRASPLIVSSNLAQAKHATNRNAPTAQAISASAGVAAAKFSTTGFQGMADSASICPYFGGCQPPDMALATSPTLVLQGVNTSFAFFNTSGQIVKGPIDTVTWYGVPALPLVNGVPCDPRGPFMSDPRAFYDPNTGLFWTATLQVEAASFGVGVNCPNLSKYWVSNTNVKTGVMHIYSFDMTLGGKLNDGADYTQLGFSASTISFTANMFSFIPPGNYDFAEVQVVDKHRMEQGLSVTPAAFAKLTVGGVFIDTVQPVQTETTPANDPGVQYLVNSFNMNGDPFGHDCATTACNGFVVWRFSPTTQALTGALVNTGVPNPTYISPPNADQPGCFQCVETIDTRITGTPVYSVGGGEPLISFSIDTGVSNGGIVNPNIVPGILWGQIQVLSGRAVHANLAQSGYLAFTGDQAASFGVMMQDENGRLFMAFDTMSANLNPSIMLVSRKASDPLGTIGNAKFIVKGPSATLDTRWGDYEAASYTGFSSNHVWVASQYSVNGDWNTFIAKVS